LDPVGMDTYKDTAASPVSIIKKEIFMMLGRESDVAYDFKSEVKTIVEDLMFSMKHSRGM
jgi:hypothetical protein